MDFGVHWTRRDALAGGAMGHSDHTFTQDQANTFVNSLLTIVEALGLDLVFWVGTENQFYEGLPPLVPAPQTLINDNLIQPQQMPNMWNYVNPNAIPGVNQNGW